MEAIEREAITGNTYPVKDRIKALGGTWDPDKKAWMVPKDRADEARALVRAVPIAHGRKDTDNRPTKVCWECGRRFTWTDCRRNDGSWDESYCGC